MTYTIGERHGQLVLQSTKPLLWRCDCGTVIKATYYSVTKGRLMSCGCRFRSRAAVIPWDVKALRPIRMVNPDAKARAQTWLVECLRCFRESEIKRSALLQTTNRYGCRYCWQANMKAGAKAPPSTTSLLREIARLRKQLEEKE